MAHTYYIIDGENREFTTLKEAKFHLWVAYTERERIKYLQGVSIFGYNSNDLNITEVKVRVNSNGQLSFSKAIKC